EDADIVLPPATLSQYETNHIIRRQHVMAQHLKLYINGKWMDSSNKKKQDILNPATQELIAQAPETTKQETENAIKTAQDTFQRGVWSDCTPQERANVLSQIADKMEANLESSIAPQ